MGAFPDRQERVRVFDDEDLYSQTCRFRRSGDFVNIPLTMKHAQATMGWGGANKKKSLQPQIQAPERSLRQTMQVAGLTRSPYPERSSNHRPSTSGPTSTGSPTLFPFASPPPPAMTDGVAATGMLPPPPRVAVDGSTAGTSAALLRPTPLPLTSLPPEWSWVSTTPSSSSWPCS